MSGKHQSGSRKVVQSPGQWFSIRQFCPSSPTDVWPCLETFLTVTSGGMHWHWQVEAWEAARATVRRTAPYNKPCPAPKCQLVQGLRNPALGLSPGYTIYLLRTETRSCTPFLSTVEDKPGSSSTIQSQLFQFGYTSKSMHFLSQRISLT